jgi:hypothetical protein
LLGSSLFLAVFAYFRQIIQIQRKQCPFSVFHAADFLLSDCVKFQGIVTELFPKPFPMPVLKEFPVYT